MKTRYILLSLTALSLTAIAAMGPPYDNSQPPTLSLPAAYQFAVTALGSATNQFHCVGASLTRDFGAPRWSFRFYTTNTPPRWKCMTVDFGGKTEEDFGARSQRRHESVAPPARFTDGGRLPRLAGGAVLGVDLGA